MKMSKAERLHPGAVLENLIKSLTSFVKATIGSLVAITFIPIGKEWIIAGFILIVVLYIVVAILRWLRFSYHVYNEELRIQQGVFLRKKTYIPLERIQSIQRSSGVVQRIFGLVNLEIQTAGANKEAEAFLPALREDQAQSLQDKLQRSRVVKENQEEAKTENVKVQKISPRELLIAGASSNGIGIILLGLVAILSQINQFIQDEDIYIIIGQHITSYIEKGIWAGLVGLTLIILLAWIASFLGAIISIAGFTLSRYSDRILIERGLLRRKQINIPIKKIQAVKIVEGILKEPFGFASLHIVSAGHGDSSASNVLIFPLLEKKEIQSFFREFLPEFNLESDLRQLAKASHVRYRIILTIPAFLLVLPLIITFKYGFIALIIPLLAYMLGVKKYHDAGWKFAGNQLTLRWRGLGLVTALIKKQRLQIFESQQNPLQKRKDLYSFNIKIASNLAPAKMGLVGIDLEDRNEIWELLSVNNFQ